MEEERFVSEVRAMERTLYRVARGYLRTWDECADAVQEALCKAWDKRKRVDESYFRPWLTRIVINECHNIGRRKKRLIPVAEPEREPVPEPVLPELADALEALPEKLRLPLTLHYLEGFSVEEIARILRIPAGTVKSRLHQARSQLRVQWLETEGNETASRPPYGRPWKGAEK